MRMEKKIRVFFLLLILTAFFKGVKAQNNPVVDSLQILIKNDKEDTLKIIHLNTLGWEIMFQNPDSAIVLGNHALSTVNTLLANPPSVNREENIKAYQKFLAKTYENIGVYYYFKGEYAISLDYNFKSVELKKAANNKNGLAATYNNIGMVYRNQGDHSKALEYYFEALKLNVELGNKQRIAHSLNNVGLVYNDQKDYKQALNYYEKSLFLHTQMDNKVSMASTLNNIGIVYYEGKKYDKALQNFFKSLSINKELDNTSEIANNYANIGSTYFDALNYPKAHEYFNNALHEYEDLGNKYGVAMSLGNIGHVYSDEKKYSEGESYLKRALELSEELEALELIKENNEILSDLYSKTNRFQLAFEHLTAFNVAKDSLFNSDKSKDIGRLEMKHEIEKAEKERLDQEEAKNRTELQNKKRRNTLQYQGIVTLILIISLCVGVIGFLKVSPKIASAITFFSFLIFFEFVLVLLGPTVDKLSGGEPAYILFFNALIAAALFPIHDFFERALKRRLTRRQMNTEEFKK